MTDAFTDGIQSAAAADEVVVLPPPEREPLRFISALGTLARGRRFVLLPGSPADVLALAPHRAALDRARVRHLLPSPRQVARLPFLGLSRVAGVRIPRSARVDLNDLRSLTRRAWRWPLVIRTPDGRSALAASIEAVTPVARSLTRPWASPTVIHEPVIGARVSVAVLGHRDGRVAGLAAAWPLVQSGNGALWSAATTTDARVLAAARGLLARARWTGPAELHLVRDQAGAFWFTGLTPGFPSWISLAHAAGRPLDRQYVRLALGAAPLRLPEYRDGLLMSRVAMDYAIPIAALGCLATEGVSTHDSRRPETLPTARPRQAGTRLAQ